MKQTLDARGKACPIPVVETRKLLATLHEGDSLEVAVDNYIAVQNLEKMAEQKRIPVSSKKIDGKHYLVTLIMTGNYNAEMTSETSSVTTESQEETVCTPDTSLDKTADINLNKTVVVFASDKMGAGDEKLGQILMKGFIYTLTEQEQLPGTILLYNKGAFLSVEDSDSLADLKHLESQGVEILTCGTCLNHYGLSEKLGVGSVTNMYVIVEKMMQAAKIIKP